MRTRSGLRSGLELVVRHTPGTIMDTTMGMARPQSARTATTAMLLMPARLTATTVPIGSLAASSSAPAPGSEAATMAAATMDVATTVADITAEAIGADAVTMAEVATTADRFMVDAESMAAAHSVIHAASPVAACTAVPLAASAAEREAGSTAAVAADSTAVADITKTR